MTIDRGSRTPSDKPKVLKLTIKGGIKLASAKSHRFDVNGVQMSVEVSSLALSTDSARGADIVRLLIADILPKHLRNSVELP